MMLPRFVFHVFVAAWLFTPGVVCAEEAHFKTPEDAITAYIGAVTRQDLGAILATTSVERKSRNFDFLSQVDRKASMDVSDPMPATSPFFIEINKSIFSSYIAKQVQFLTYSLMSNNDIVKGKSVGPIKIYGSVKNNENIAIDFVNIVQSARLSDLSISKIGIPVPNDLNTDRTQANFVKIAKIYGADTMTERVVLLSFNGINFMVGFSLFRYGDEWLVDAQVSNYAGTSMFGTAQRITPAEFDNILK